MLFWTPNGRGLSFFFFFFFFFFITPPQHYVPPPLDVKLFLSDPPQRIALFFPSNFDAMTPLSDDLVQQVLRLSSHQDDRTIRTRFFGFSFGFFKRLPMSRPSSDFPFPPYFFGLVRSMLLPSDRKIFPPPCTTNSGFRLVQLSTVPPLCFPPPLSGIGAGWFQLPPSHSEAWF